MVNGNLSRKKRLLLLFYVAAALFVVLFVQLGNIMFLQAGELQEMAELQWTKETSVTAERGKILDANGVVLAQSATVKSVLLKPKDIEDPGEIANLLAPILQMDAQTIYEAATKNKTEVWLKRHITREQEQQILALNLENKGVSFFTDTKRYYPYNDFLSQVLGYTNIDGDGQEGIEKRYNKYLTGYSGTTLSLVDARQRTIAGSEQIYIDALPGLDVVMTVDSVIQGFLENAAREALEVNQAQSVTAIVMDPQDSSILGMVNYPEADLNNLNRDDLEELNELSRNRAVVDAYEPGSTFKIITTAAALDSGAATTESRYTCVGYKLVDGERIKCWRSGRPHGTQTLAEGVQNSCNPVFMELALEMGTETFYEYIYSFGFGSKTGIDYSADAAGIVRDSKYVKNVDLARIGFGQSIAVTPLQLTTAVAAVINGGTLYSPRLVSELRDSDGNTVQTFEPQAVRQVISESTSATMREILEGVVSNGSGSNCKIEGYRVGGKTGTAQMYENGVIVQGKNISSFIGFAPADDPQYLVLFVVNQPGVPVTFGSVVAAPFAKDVLEQCLKYGQVPPTEETEERVEVPNLVGKTAEEARALAEEAGLQIELYTDGEVAAQSPVAGTSVLKGSLVAAVSNQTEAVDTVPNVVGETLENAFKLLSAAGLEMEYVNEQPGNSIVTAQEPTAGSTYTPGQTVKVTGGPKRES